MVFSSLHQQQQQQQQPYKKRNIFKTKKNWKKNIGILFLTLAILILFVTIPTTFLFKYGDLLIFSKFKDMPKILIWFNKQTFFKIDGMAEIIIILASLFLIFFIIGISLIFLKRSKIKICSNCKTIFKLNINEKINTCSLCYENGILGNLIDF